MFVEEIICQLSFATCSICRVGAVATRRTCMGNSVPSAMRRSQVQFLYSAFDIVLQFFLHQSILHVAIWALQGRVDVFGSLRVNDDQKERSEEANDKKMIINDTSEHVPITIEKLAGGSLRDAEVSYVF